MRGRAFLHPTPARRADGQLRPVLVPNLECAAFHNLVPVPVAKLVERLRLVSIDLKSHSGDSTRLAALGALAKRHRWGWCAPSRGLLAHLVKQTQSTRRQRHAVGTNDSLGAVCGPKH
jgi:hypothetical protein